MQLDVKIDIFRYAILEGLTYAATVFKRTDKMLAIETGWTRMLHFSPPQRHYYMVLEDCRQRVLYEKLNTYSSAICAQLCQHAQ